MAMKPCPYCGFPNIEERSICKACKQDMRLEVAPVSTTPLPPAELSRLLEAEIVRQQDAFFRHGVRYLRPLVLRDIATAIEMHESTVSRVTTNKYLAAPHGIYELKYFFTSAIASASGGEAHSAEAVRARIRTLIESESPDQVLSDDKLVELLRKDGVDIARRTVAKYREAMRIPSSVQRRREKSLRL